MPVGLDDLFAKHAPKRITVVPEGIYTLEVVDIKRSKTSTGKEHLKPTFKVLPPSQHVGEFIGGMAWWLHTSGGRDHTADCLVTFGWEGESDPRAIIGNVVRVLVEREGDQLKGYENRIPFRAGRPVEVADSPARVPGISGWVYGAYDPEEPQRGVRYIGGTEKEIGERLHEHIGEAKEGSANHFHVWIRHLLENGRAPAVMVIESVPDAAEIGVRESARIALAREQSWDLLNMTDGGDGLLPKPEVKS